MAPNTSPRVRLATPQDALALAALAETTFRGTFSETNTKADIETYVRRAFSIEQIDKELREPSSVFLLALACADGAPIGYSKLRDGLAEPCVAGPDPIELERLYVSRSAIGRGVGATLMRASLAEAGRRGHKTLWLGVWEHNERAIAFYRKWSFREVGSHLFTLGSDDQTDLIFERPTTPY